jgi:hypothetical protein
MTAGVQSSAKHAIGVSKMTWMPTYWSPLSFDACFNLNKNITIIYVLFIWSTKYLLNRKEWMI